MKLICLIILFKIEYLFVIEKKTKFEVYQQSVFIVKSQQNFSASLKVAWQQQIYNKINNIYLQLQFPFEISGNFEIFWEILDQENYCSSKSKFNYSQCIKDLNDNSLFTCLLQNIQFDGSLYLNIQFEVFNASISQFGYLSNLKISILLGEQQQYKNIAQIYNYFPFYRSNTQSLDQVYLEYMNISESLYDYDQNMINQTSELIIKFKQKKQFQRVLFTIKNLKEDIYPIDQGPNYKDIQKESLYNFSSDTRSNCKVYVHEVNKSSYQKFENYDSISQENLDCTFENEYYKGLIFNIKKNNLDDNQEHYMYFRFYISNSKYPSEAKLSIYVFQNNSFIVKQFVELPFKLYNKPLLFQDNYPKLLISNNQDVANEESVYFLYSSPLNLQNVIVYNSLKFIFQIQSSLPKLQDNFFYRILIKLNLNQNSKIPENYIYHNLPIIKDQEEILVINSTKYLQIDYVGELKSSQEYFIGFKLILDGGENLNLNQMQDQFGNMQIKVINLVQSYENQVVYNKDITINSDDKFNMLIQSTYPIKNTNAKYLFHSLPIDALQNDYTNINTDDNFGCIKGQFDQYLFAKTNFFPSKFIAEQSILEFILPKNIFLSNTQLQVSKGIQSNCQGIVRDNQGNNLDQVDTCFFIQEDSYNKVILTFASANVFNSNQDHIIGFGPVVIDKYYSYFDKDLDFEVLDVIMNYYEQVTYYSFEQFKSGKEQIKIKASLSFMGNLFVRNYEYKNHFNNINFQILNYYELTNFDDFNQKIPTILKISGVLDAIDLRENQKIALIYDEQYFDFYQSSDVQKNESQMFHNISCSSQTEMDQEQSQCKLHKGSCNFQCTSFQCTQTLLCNRLEIEISNKIYTQSKNQPFQILLPVKLKQNVQNVKFQLGGIKQNQILTSQSVYNYTTVKEIIGIQISPNFQTQESNIFLTAGEVQANQAYISGLSRLDVSMGQFGETIQEANLELHTNETFFKPNFLNQEYFSFTICSNFEVYRDEFKIDNKQQIQSKQCVYNINFFITSQRYCMWCPYYNAGQDSLLIQLQNFFLNPSNQDGINFSNDILIGLSGIQNQYGLYKITQQSFTGKNFGMINYFQKVQIEPYIFDQNFLFNVNFYLQFKLSFLLKQGQYLLIQSNTQIPFSQALCQIIQNGAQNIQCQLQSLDQKNLYIYINQDLSQEIFKIHIYGLHINDAVFNQDIYQLNFYFKITTNKNDALTNQNRITYQTNDYSIMVFEKMNQSIELQIDDFQIQTTSTKALNQIFLHLIIQTNFDYKLTENDMIQIDFTNAKIQKHDNTQIVCNVLIQDKKVYNTLHCDCQQFPQVYIFFFDVNILQSFTINLQYIQLQSFDFTNYVKMYLKTKDSQQIIFESQDVFLAKFLQDKDFNIQQDKIDVLNYDIKVNNNYYGLYQNIDINLTSLESYEEIKLLLTFDECYDVNKNWQIYALTNDVQEQISFEIFEPNSIIAKFYKEQTNEQIFIRITNIKNFQCLKQKQNLYIALVNSYVFDANSEVVYFSAIKKEASLQLNNNIKEGKVLIEVDQYNLRNNNIAQENTVQIKLNTKQILNQQNIIQLQFQNILTQDKIYCQIVQQEIIIDSECYVEQNKIQIKLSNSELISDSSIINIKIYNLKNTDTTLDCELQFPQIVVLNIENDSLVSFVNNELINLDAFRTQISNKHDYYMIKENSYNFINGIINYLPLQSRLLYNDVYYFDILKNSKYISFNIDKTHPIENFGNKLYFFKYYVNDYEQINNTLNYNISIEINKKIKTKSILQMQPIQLSIKKQKFFLKSPNENTQNILNYYNVDENHKQTNIFYDINNKQQAFVLFNPLEILNNDLVFEILSEEMCGLKINQKELRFTIFQNYQFLYFDVVKEEKILKCLENQNTQIFYFKPILSLFYQNLFFQKQIEVNFFDSQKNQSQSNCIVNINNVLRHGIYISYECYTVFKIYYYFMPKQFYKDLEYNQIQDMTSNYNFININDIFISGWQIYQEALSMQNSRIFSKDQPLLSNQQYQGKLFIEINQEIYKTQKVVFQTLKDQNNNFKMDLIFAQNLLQNDRNRLLCFFANYLNYPTMYIYSSQGDYCQWESFEQEQDQQNHQNIQQQEIFQIVHQDQLDQNQQHDHYAIQIYVDQIQTKNDNPNVYQNLIKTNNTDLTNKLNEFIFHQFQDKQVKLNSLSQPSYYTKHKIQLQEDFELYYIHNNKSIFITNIDQQNYDLYYMIFDIDGQEDNILINYIERNLNNLLFYQANQNKNGKVYFTDEKVQDFLLQFFPVPSNFMHFGKFQSQQSSSTLQIETKNFQFEIMKKKTLWIFQLKDKNHNFMTSILSNKVYKILQPYTPREV